MINVLDYGAVADFWNGSGTDNTAAFLTAIAAAAAKRETLYLPPSTAGYLVSQKLTIPAGVSVQGGGGAFKQSLLVSSALDAPVIHGTGRGVKIDGIAIDATPDRRNSGASEGHGIQIAGGNHTNFSVTNCSVIRQPACGIDAGGALLMANFSGNILAENMGAGLRIHDGSLSGFAPANPASVGAINIKHNRINCNGGNGVQIGSQTIKIFRPLIENNELTNNAWNPLTRITDDQMFVNADSIYAILNGYGDDGFALTVTPSGAARVAKDGAGGAVLAKGYDSLFEMERYINVSRSIRGEGLVCATIRSPRIISAPKQPIGFDFDTNCHDVQLDIGYQSGVTMPVKARTNTVSWRYYNSSFTGPN